MKTLHQFLGVALMSALLLALNFGCASTGSNGSGGKSGAHGLTLNQSFQQVEDAMLTARNASVAGALTTAQREGIENAYKQFKTIYAAALSDAGSNQDALAPTNVKAAAENVIARVSALP